MAEREAPDTADEGALARAEREAAAEAAAEHIPAPSGSSEPKVVTPRARTSAKATAKAAPKATAAKAAAKAKATCQKLPEQLAEGRSKLLAGLQKKCSTPPPRSFRTTK